MNENFDLIEKNIADIREKMSDFPNAHLIAAIKTRGDGEIRKAYECGVHYFGENRVQELIAKYDALEREKTRHRQRIAGMTESRKATELRSKIFRHSTELGRKLINGSDNKHIPQELHFSSQGAKSFLGRGHFFAFPLNDRFSPYSAHMLRIIFRILGMLLF